jgi:hypothetical protein
MVSRIIFILGLLAIAGAWLALISATAPPDRLIMGTWSQVSWEYEAMEAMDEEVTSDFLDMVKRSVGEGLVMHEAETWEFLPGHRLKLVHRDGEEVVQWRLKGRGHILQIIHDNGVRENYQLDKLDRSTLQLCIETNIQARGIARLVFNKDP